MSNTKCYVKLSKSDGEIIMQNKISKELYYQVRNIMKKRWNVREGEYWYPLIENGFEPKIALDYDGFISHYNELKFKKLVKILINEDIFEIAEYDFFNSFVMLSDEFEIYCGSELFWTVNNAEWLIYKSHEDTLTFAGEKALDILKGCLPDYKDYCW
ncbi:hypothetical protein AN2V17_38790 [Vallitalea sp. AN17-2]|uniref:Uncharacterized protein n=1 Tax=Vallitalea maricola TaxID=3074433 RepID=A0ACB5UQ90_9FIRM|nr:hypothetical protein AN2V17_38790 [Vallitalea sp. AN17-2]